MPEVAKYGGLSSLCIFDRALGECDPATLRLLARASTTAAPCENTCALALKCMQLSHGCGWGHVQRRACVCKPSCDVF